MDKPEKLEMQSADGVQLNLDALYQIAPSCFTEAADPKTGKVKRMVNFNTLRQLLGDDTVEDAPEAYEFNWVGKQAARAEVLRPIKKTLRPVKEDSVDWDNTQNLYIEGDNLEVLKLLQKSYLNQVKMIYIDPPYNTGKNLIYKNDFSVSEKEFLIKSGVIDEYNNRLVTNTQANGRFHSDWCSMIYARLLVCRSLLTKDGIICLTIDDSEIENVTAIMNEVFGEVNHLATIVVKNNPSGRSTTKGASISHEYALFYGADEDTTLGRLPRNEAQIARYKEKDEMGAFEWVNFRKHGGYKEDAPSMYYPIYVKRDCSSFRIPKLEWNDNQKEYIILEEPMTDETISLPIDEQGRPRRWKWGLDRALSCPSEMMAKKDRSGEPTVYIKARMNDEGMLPLTVWDDKQYSSTEYGANLLKKMFGASYFDYPKSLYAVIDSLKIGSLDKNSIVLDFFSGSATTAHATMQLNAEDGGKRKFICAQIPEKTDCESESYKAGYKTICEIGKERIRRAGKKIKEEHPEVQDLDTGFRVFRVDSSNFEEVEHTPKDWDQTQLELFLNNIKADRDDLDLLFGCLLDWGVKLSLPITSEEVDGKMIYTVNEGDLVACFAEKVTDNVVKAMADKMPLRVIFRDSCFDQDADKINIYETFKQLLDWTDEQVVKNIRVI
ncbi:MAG: site-specific DNA-methyltransferase [Bacteroidales bacterium]|nr:site-specific DNA-methyltransferase [Bacteroidales bacterium]